jgi:hypothetical protein
MEAWASTMEKCLAKASNNIQAFLCLTGKGEYCQEEVKALTCCP